MSSGPHQRNIGWRELSMMPTVALRLAGHDSTGPSGVFDQSSERTRAPGSPPPASHSRAARARLPALPPLLHADRGGEGRRPPEKGPAPRRWATLELEREAARRQRD